MVKVHPEIVLDVNALPTTNEDRLSDAPSTPKVTAPRELPKPLADFKAYVDSKFCYHASALETATLLNVQSKIAYKYLIKLLVETRSIHWSEKPATWHHETVLGSETLGRFFENTTRNEQEIQMWQYHFDVPSSDGRSKSRRVLGECAYSTRCSNCRGKGLVTCSAFGCNGTGKQACNDCSGTGRRNVLGEYVNCHCDYGKVRCSECGGGGKIHCGTCKGCGGFLHTPTLEVRWRTRKNVQYAQNSFLPSKRIEKGQRSHFWSKTDPSWTDHSSIDTFYSSLQQDEVSENISLKTDLIQEYRKQYGKVHSGKLRRLAVAIERLDFEEIHYDLDEKYENKRHSQLGHTFRFCQYPVQGKGQIIYEDDYPLNCCGCFGEKYACYSSCCTIL